MNFAAFTQLEKIAGGSLTTVYRAYQPELERRVLLKVLHAHLAEESELVARFQREAKACARVQHENIVHVHELNQSEGSWYIVMEYVDGESLQKLLERDGALTPEKARKILIDCLRGLRAAHEKGVLHRDIKPANILITANGQAKLTDFGLARIEGGSSLTQETTVLGTPAYMSPEQLNGDQLDGRSDLFSLGAVYYEMLTGEAVFSGETFAESFARVMTHEIPRVPSVDDQANALLARLLARDVSDRFTDAGAVLAFLGETPPQSAAKPAVATSSRHRRMVGLVTALVLILAGIVAINQLFLANFNSDSDESFSDISKPQAARLDTQPPAAVTTANDDTNFVATPVDTPQTVAPLTVQPNTNPPAEPETHAVADAPGFLQISCRPWANVRVDGRLIGSTPLSTAIELEPGDHTVQFENPAFPVVVRQITIEAGQTLEWQEDLWEQVGYLSLKVSPWADVYLNDRQVATTPIAKPLIQPVGQYMLALEHPHFQRLTRLITIHPGDTTFVSCQMGERIVVQNMHESTSRD